MSFPTANDLMTTIITTAAEAAGSEVGGSIGGAVASQVTGGILSVVGLQQGSELTAVQQTLTDIEAGIAALSTQLADVAHQDEWNTVYPSILSAKTNIENLFGQVAAIVNSTVADHARDTQLSAYLQTVNTQMLDNQLSTIHGTIMGAASGLTPYPSYLSIYLPVFWSQFYGAAVNNDFPTAAKKIMTLFVQLGQLQQKGTVLLYNCYQVGTYDAATKKVVKQPTLAVKAMTDLAANMKLQYNQFQTDSPTMMALYNMKPSQFVVAKFHLAGSSLYLSPFGSYFRLVNNNTTVFNMTDSPDSITYQFTWTAYNLTYSGDAAKENLLYTIAYSPDPNNTGHFAWEQGLGISLNDTFTIYSATVTTALAVDAGDAGVSGHIIQTSPAQTALVHVLMGVTHAQLTNLPKAWFRLVPTSQMNQYQILLENATDFGAPSGAVLAYQTSGLAGSFAQFLPPGQGSSNWILEGFREFQIPAGSTAGILQGETQANLIQLYSPYH